MSAHQWLRDKADNKPVRVAGWGVYVSSTVFLLGVGIWIIVKLHQQSSLSCPAKSNALPDPWMILAGFGALLVGRFIGTVRFIDDWRNPPDREDSNTLGKRASLAFIFLCFVALIYEALGEQQFNLTKHDTIPGLAPITEYTRCSIYYAKQYGWPTIIVYAVIMTSCALVGNWLWAYHPHDDFESRPADAVTPEAAHG